MDGHGYQMANARPYEGHTQVQSCETELINYILL